MKKTKTNTIMKKIFYTVLLALSFCATASAQHNLRTGYFLDGYIYKHKLNPAFASDRGYFAIPVAGYVSAGVESNLAVSTFLTPDGNGNLMTFLNPSVSTEDFLSGIAENNPLNVNVDIPVLSFGFHAGKSFNTLDLSLKTDVRTNIPGSMFSWAKQYGDTFDMSNFGLNADARLELAYGYSRQFGEKFRFGFKLKFIAGLAKANYAMEQLTMTMTESEWSVASKGAGYFAAPGIGFKTTDAGAISGFNVPSDYQLMIDSAIQNKNYGGAVDLGFSWDIFKWLTLSASVTDLGFVNWNGVSRLESAERVTAYTGFDNLGPDTDMSAIGAEFNALGEQIMDALYPKVVGTNELLKENLSATAHAGLELRVPFYKRLSVGVLATHRFDGAYSWKELRGSVNWALFRWLSFSASHAESTYGQSFGGAVNFHPRGLNIFVGVDSYKPVMNVSPQYIPIDSFNTTVAAGINFAFGKYRGRYPRKSQVAAAAAAEVVAE